MQKQKYFFGFLSLVVISITSCGEFRKLQKSDDWEKKYDAAMRYYEQEEYYKASVLFEDVLPIIRGTQKSENAQFYYAYSYFHQQKYQLSSHYFKKFYETYSRSEKSKEAMFMHAYSLYMQSPVFNLDQSSTKKAIDAMQRFLNQYPYSDFRERANRIIEDLHEKLEKKAFDNAKLYYELEKYQAAVVAFDNFQDDYPDSHFNEQAGYLKVAAEYKIAKQSVQSKQKERFRQTIEYYQNFIDNYPNSQYIKEAQNIYDECRAEINKLASNNKNL